MDLDHEEMKKAVALRYSRERDSAPRVVASGQGSLAEEIIKLAELKGIKLHQDRSLVETLLKFDMGKEIPPELYQVVAEVFAMVYKLDKGLEVNRPNE